MKDEIKQLKCKVRALMIAKDKYENKARYFENILRNYKNHLNKFSKQCLILIDQPNTHLNGKERPMKQEHPSAFKFYKAYANIPLSLRDEICCILDDEPLTWKTVKIELDEKTCAGYDAIDQLIKLEII